jgi:hypothetical protein
MVRDPATGGLYQVKAITRMGEFGLKIFAFNDRGFLLGFWKELDQQEREARRGLAECAALRRELDELIRTNRALDGATARMAAYLREERRKYLVQLKEISQQRPFPPG